LSYRRLTKITVEGLLRYNFVVITQLVIADVARVIAAPSTTWTL